MFNKELTIKDLHIANFICNFVYEIIKELLKNKNYESAIISNSTDKREITGYDQQVLLF